MGRAAKRRRGARPTELDRLGMSPLVFKTGCAWWGGLGAQRTIGARCRVDGVDHERLDLRPWSAGEDRWYVFTPDLDVYVEAVSVAPDAAIIPACRRGFAMGYGDDLSLGDEVGSCGQRSLRAGPDDLLPLNGTDGVHCWWQGPDSVLGIVRSELRRWGAGAGDAVGGTATPPTTALAAGALGAAATRAERGRLGPSGGPRRETLGLETDETVVQKGGDPAADTRTMWVGYGNHADIFESRRGVIRKSMRGRKERKMEYHELKILCVSFYFGK
ncbi:unnamed protein product, partial [Prorocentrum cordatum]